MLQRIPSFALGIALGLSISVPSASAAANTVLSQTPLFVSEAAPPMNMLVVAKDHKLFAPAYNDASDLDEDGVLDIYYKPDIDYTGYFDSYKCYSYANNVFTPVATTQTKTCTNQADARWSGDYLNYLTMSRIDVLRKVLYGGYRYTDTTTETVLERVFIPNDAHTWGKEYLSIDRDGYDIADYTPISKPTNGKYILFANTSRPTTSGTNSLYTYSGNGAVPKLRIITSTQQGNKTYRIWGWVSREVNQGTNAINADDSARTGTTITPTYDLTVRVKACVSGLLEDNCKLNKPTGLLHDYGASDKMYFGLMTGTFTNNLRGGALRKAPTTSFSNEFNSSTGRFLTNNSGTNVNADRNYVDASGIVANLDRLVYLADCRDTWSTSFSNGTCRNWGNPLGEMAYETLRYFAGTSANSHYASGNNDTNSPLSLPSAPNWSNPYSADTIATCAAPFMTLVSDVNPSHDSDVPGSSLGTDEKPTDDLGFSFATLGDTLWSKEVGGSASINIGQSGSTSDNAPTAKTANSFANIRGLPEEPTQQGSYSTAAVTYFGSQNEISASGSHPVQSFSVALSSTLPNIQITSGNNTVTFKPYGMVVSNSLVEAITGFYMDTMANTSSGNQNSSLNGGRPYYKFRVVYDDAGATGDYDMDAIVLYEVKLNADGTVSITTDTEYSVSGAESHMGYTISGTTKDGIYLEVAGGVGGTSGKDSSTVTRYKFDTPSGKWSGECNNNGSASTSCARLPGRAGSNAALSAGTSNTRTFTPSSTTGVTTLKDPMWYAAKYGKSDLTTWDTNNDGVPDNYFLVSNPTKLQAQLKSAFDGILQLNSSVTAPSISSEAAQDSSTSDSIYTYTTSFSVDGWSGDLKKINTSTSEVVWNAASNLRASGRNIYFAGTNNTLTSFTWENLTTDQKTLLNRDATGTVDSKGQARVDFIRGNSNASFRSRDTLLGDIINSSPLLVTGADYDTARANSLEESSSYATFKSQQSAHPNVIYVGANDGMLHAFNAADGTELFSFVPKAVLPNLPVLTASDYGQEGGTEHQYFVDGTPIARDVYFNGEWHKVLLGSLGAGGREVFALDITNPAEPQLLWEFTNDDDGDMGYSVPKPNIARLHNGKWVALVPNGYESGNATKAVLFVLDIETGELLKKLTATPTLSDGETAGTLGNGLSRITDSDFNGDGIADYAYAGDLLGNLWRFDLLDTSAEMPLTADATDAQFAVSFGGNPLYVARDASGKRQPITAAPTLVKHPSGVGYLAIVGTGRYLTTTDKTSTDRQSLYGIWDRKTAGEATNSSLSASKVRRDLTQQTLTQTTFNNATVFTLSNNDITWYDAEGTADNNVNKWGWYLDFTQSGERLIYNMNLYGNTLILSSITPTANACSAGMTGTVYGLNPRSGGATRYATFDLNGDGTYDAGYAGFVIDGGDFSISSGKIYVNANDGGTEETPLNPGISEGRQTWRQITTEEE
ncbi:pilus assembly protein [Phytopseudomonas dryadis]|uniref:Pilus assembly protein PilY n=1 Tax=Phytopseudomonas dryadis TaxID=2487520 RepID=A0ABY1Z7R7_9GAMM|nr:MULTISPECIES: PilC/PilY family type IV pilus protein [Pseudomonas]TBV04696.1 pilus assembly protein PilY [Pseudomonas dryadis]TBV17217.1 pilus assembly protein PilY [Pseudomonas sp. FRB 230]